MSVNHVHLTGCQSTVINMLTHPLSKSATHSCTFQTHCTHILVRYLHIYGFLAFRHTVALSCWQTCNLHFNNHTREHIRRNVWLNTEYNYLVFKTVKFKCMLNNTHKYMWGTCKHSWPRAWRMGRFHQRLKCSCGNNCSSCSQMCWAH